MNEIVAKISKVHSSVLRGNPGNFEVLSVFKKDSIFVADISGVEGNTNNWEYVKLKNTGFTPAKNVTFLPQIPKKGKLLS